jgi:hypothetical protein
MTHLETDARPANNFVFLKSCGFPFLLQIILSCLPDDGAGEVHAIWRKLEVHIDKKVQREQFN